MSFASLARLLGALGLLSIAACATEPPKSDPVARAEFQRTNDPLEPTNRVFYAVDDRLDTYILRPVAWTYVHALPTPVRTSVHNALANLSAPVVFANDVAQAKPRRAGTTFMRFLINSTAGVGGLFDVAKRVGYRGHDADFGETMALWGVPSGPFLFLPVLGPSNPRDASGFAADTLLSPFTYVPRGYGLLTLDQARYGVGVVDARAQVLGQLAPIKRDALDPYATFRSLFRQHRASEIEAAKAADRMTVPDWFTH